MKNDKKLLVWIYFLNYIAGYVNFSMFFLFATTVTHFTGPITRIPFEFVEGDYAQILFYLSLIGSFCLGVMINGMLLHKKVFYQQKYYGVMTFILGLLSCCLSCLPQVHTVMLPFFALIGGLHNGMYITYNGMVVRMTHFTGYLTELSFSIGRYLRGSHEDNFKILFCLNSIVSFMLGACTVSILVLQYNIFFLPIISMLYFVVTLYYFKFLYGVRKVND